MDDKTTFRFLNIIISYKELQTGSLTTPKSAGDIRKIYDEITIDGVLPEDLPGGKFFRREVTYVYTHGQYEIHRGITSSSETEEYIIDTMDKLLNFVNNESQCNQLIKNAIFHYYFGYVHPFYDGNGRTTRFISSMYIKEDYSWLTALSLSQGCNENKALYLKAFHKTNQVSMQGELKVLTYTDQTIRKKLNQLYQGNFLNKISKNPVRYTLNPDFLENF